MGMLQRLSHDLRAGWVTLRHGTAKAATRALEEGELLRYRLELRKVDQQLDDLHVDIGERTIALHDRGNRSTVSCLILKSPTSCNRCERCRMNAPSCCWK